MASLEQLQNAGVPLQTADHTQPGSFPLPPSASSLHGSQTGDHGANGISGVLARRKIRRRRSTTDPTTYAERIRPLIRCMPHLACLEWTNRECRNPNAGEVSLVNFYGALSKTKVSSLKEADVDCTKWPSILKKNLKKPSKDVSSRLIIVEDLSTALIEGLGSYFNVGPEAFALQLTRGRPSKESPVDDQDGEWNKSGMPKSSASIQWYRPVRLPEGVAQWLKDPASLRRLLGVSSSGEDEDVYLSWDQKQVKHWKKEQHGITGTSRFVSQRDIHHRARITTNAFRRSWLLSTKTAKAAKVARTTEEDSVPTTWEERATIFKIEHSVPTFILLLDPIPRITDSQRVTETRLRLNPVPTKVTREPTDETHEVEVFLPSRIRVPIKLPSNKLNVSEDEMQELRKASEATSTGIAVVSWLSTLHDPTNPVLALLEVVRLNSIAFFDSLDSCLMEISEDSMGDYLMSRRLADWRQLLNDFELKVTEISQSLHDFVDFAFDGPATRPARVDEIIEELDSRSQRFAQRIEKAYAALRAEMGVFESRRSIAEAETVTKLTELAFVFIPLTFCCGLFSMQVNELQNGVPLTMFVITAVIVFVICYGARIVMRSSIIVESMQSAQENLWTASKMKPGSQIPTRQLVWLTLKEAWKRGGSAVTYIVFLSVLSFTVVPVAFLWTRVRMDASLTVMIMLLLVPTPPSSWS